MKSGIQKFLLVLLAASLLLGGCSTSKDKAGLSLTPRPVQTLALTPIIEPTAPQAPLPARLSFDASVPPALRRAAQAPAGMKMAVNARDATVTLGVQAEGGQTQWVYALVAPFPTLFDAVSLDELVAVWHGLTSAAYAQYPLRLSSETLEAFTQLWGAPAPSAVEVVDRLKLLELAWSQPGSLAILPFEELEPRWKVLRVDDQSPIDKGFDADAYPLTIRFGLSETEPGSAAKIVLPATNRDPEKMTVILMTGVTALVRATAVKMEKMGMAYPGRDVLPWFEEADIRHISNEIAFSPDCPDPNAYQTALIFCSKPEYSELLEYVGANVIELTGNHQMDWGHNAFTFSLNLYDELGMQYYAAGENAAKARAPLLIEDHGNKIAFIGCNPSGPELVWATDEFPGVAQCDFEWMQSEIRWLRSQGYLPIATMQYFEYYTPDPRPWQVEDFRGLAEAGAVIVSGSQAHKPQAFDFFGSNFIHYGVGNLFFDQMDIPVKGTRQEFLDRHIIYDGRYISTELKTAMLEDFARPRPMTEEERQQLLQDMFIASGWLEKVQ
ncbi:MAG TPA: CapA family protein [Anaerolineaceae bacterium]